MISAEAYNLEQDTPVQVVFAHHSGQEVHLHNSERLASRDAFVGPTDSVDETNGHHIAAGTDVKIMVPPGDVLWAMTPDNNCDFTVLTIAR
jgi:hypothetical protein